MGEARMSEVERRVSDEEQWLPVVGYEGVYTVSDLGKVWSIERTVPGGRWGRMVIPGRMLSTFPVRGYLAVNLYRDKKATSHRVHRLVLEAFVGPCPEGLQCLHDNDIRTDNRLLNLAWGTPSQNSYDRYRNGYQTYNVRKTECPRGHLLEAPNLMEAQFRKGLRNCRACNNKWYVQKLSWDEFLNAADARYLELTGLEPNLTAPGRSPKVAI